MVELSEPQKVPKPCRNNKCCGKYLFYAEKAGERQLVPLKKVNIKAELRGSIAVTNVELTYFNPDPKNPMECTYVFPLEKTTILSHFEAKIGDTFIFTKVTDKETAQEKYED